MVLRLGARGGSLWVLLCIYKPLAIPLNCSPYNPLSASSNSKLARQTYTSLQPVRGITVPLLWPTMSDTLTSCVRLTYLSPFRPLLYILLRSFNSCRFIIRHNGISPLSLPPCATCLVHPQRTRRAPIDILATTTECLQNANGIGITTGQSSSRPLRCKSSTLPLRTRHC
jgi:hypothetical protein